MIINLDVVIRKNMNRHTFKPQIPILFFSNITELTEVTEYVKRSKKNTVLWTSPRRGHCNINGPEKEIALMAIENWVENSKKPGNKTVKVDVSAKIQQQNIRMEKFLPGCSKSARLTEVFNVDLTRKDLEKAGVKQDSYFQIGFKDKKFKIYLGYTYSDVKRGEWISFITAADYVKVARNWENAQKLLRCKEGDEVFFEVIKTKRNSN